MGLRPTPRRRREKPRRGSYDPSATSSERRDVERRRQDRKRRRLIRIGQVLMLVGAAMGVIHLLTHLGAFGPQPAGIVDLLVGYPTAAVLFVFGAIAAGQ